MVTIKHRISGTITDVTPEKWESMKGRSRNWEKIGESRVLLGTGAVEDQNQEDGKLKRKAKGKGEIIKAQNPHPEAKFYPAGTEKVEGVLDFVKESDTIVTDTEFGKMEINKKLADELRQGDWKKAAE